MVSTSSGPIPTHAGYDKTGGDKVYIERPAPRVRPEAQGIYRQAQGSVGLVLQIEGHRPPSSFSRAKPAPKDHLGENVKRMRRIQRQMRTKEAQKEEAQPKPVKALWKSTKYEGVQSRVKEELHKGPAAPRPSSANYLRAHSRMGIPLSARPASTEPEDDSLSEPRAETAREFRPVRRDLDFIKMNGQFAKKASIRKSPSLSALDDLKQWKEEQDSQYAKGQIPKYLQQRKKQWEKEEQDRVASIPDPDLPEGHRVMPDNERRATLEKLKQTEQELQRQLSMMPVRTDTYRVRRRKEEIEAKLAEVEAACKIFARKKVFVKLDQ